MSIVANNNIIKSEDTSKRIVRPTPKIADRIKLDLPNLPEVLQGITVLHISDIHIRRYKPWFRRVIEMCSRECPDFVWMTGDYVTQHGDEKAALRVMSDLLDALSPCLGIFGSFGNHDTPAFKRLAIKHLTKCHWLEHTAIVLPDYEITLLGTSTPCDILKTLRHALKQEQDMGYHTDNKKNNKAPYRIVLGHEPGILVTCAELGIEWTLAGHTHGGQLRFGFPFALHNSTDIPGNQSSGILRCRDSICTISRGLGESYFDIRLMCPPHLPMYILNRGELPGQHCRKMKCVRWW